MDCKEILKWSKLYDVMKYPFGMYQDLVINGSVNPRRFELMGAWKTGSIRIVDGGNEYTDTNGMAYGFTRRWAPHAPVGYNVWRALDEMSPCAELPTELPGEIPSVLSTLIGTDGFGFIWALFVAHVCKPTVYPLYDQHVWRAYRWLESGGCECPDIAPSDWNSYLRYASFFKALLAKCGYDYWIVDRGLWSFGKGNRSKRPPVVVAPSDSLPTSKPLDMSDEMVYGTTLSRKKPFWWAVDENGNISVRRVFKVSRTIKGIRIQVEQVEIKQVSCEIIESLLVHLSDRRIFPDGRFPLAHSVTSLSDGSETDGIGKFLYDNGFIAQDAQLASHLAAIFYSAGLWDFNNALNGQRFWLSGSMEDWCSRIRRHFDELNVEDDSTES